MNQKENSNPKNSGPSGEGTPVPSITLPKGGGAVRGIDEKFTINSVTGTGSLSVPIASSPGRSGFGPRLSLSYDSGRGNGPFGFGWDLELPSITRKTDKGLPRYIDADESDTFVLSGAEDLVPVLDGDGARLRFARTVHDVAYDVYPYRPRVEGLFARIERWARTDTGTSHWRSITRDNVTTLYGFDGDSRVADPTDSRRIFSYLICRTFDDRGNVCVYDYAAEDDVGVQLSRAHESNREDVGRRAQRYLRSVHYGNAEPYFHDWSAEGTATPLPSEWLFKLVLDYGDHSPEQPRPAPDHAWNVRPDPFSSYRSGFEVRTYRRCERVLLFHNFPLEEGVGADCLVHSTDFQYSDEQTPEDPRHPVYTFLRSVTQAGYRRQGQGYLRRPMPPLEFEYSEPRMRDEVLTLDAESFVNLPEGLDGSRFRWVDLDGEGLSGILADHDGGWGYKRNLSPLNETTRPDGSRATLARFGPPESVAPLPSPNRLGGKQQLLDLSGDGQLDVVAFEDPVPGFFERTADEGWEPFRAFDSLPRLDWSAPNLHFIDLTGDGHSDILITEDGLFTFYPSLGESGFAAAEAVRVPLDEARGARVLLADKVQTVQLADMSGDGLSDIVRIRNGEVAYWPNLGYGRFGAKVTMDAAPRFADDTLFDPRRIRLADIDGSGTTDILYVGAGGVTVCFNRSGNSWAEPRRIALFPAADDRSAVQVLDLLGTGTACLVWSSPLPSAARAPLRYVDLMGGQKPHLLVRARNNLGAETRMRYAPSTRFYLADKEAGRPWVTRLPFPVHVVERVETYDWLGRGRFVTRYAYHHGYFDGHEREFRGFGMVEQWDTEEHRGDTDFAGSDAANWDAASWSPPVLTRTWFHNGAFVEAGAVSRQYAREYWTEPALRPEERAADREALLLPDTILPPGLSPAEVREAHRALKGMVLRTEVYAEDGSPRAEHPYAVTEQNFAVRRLQPTGRNRHAVFLTHPREAVAYNYERAPEDPRITHELTLEVDDYGNVRRSVKIGYPRRAGGPAPEPSLAPAFRQMLARDQSRLHVAASESRFTRDELADAALLPDTYRTPLLSEGITSELTGLDAPVPVLPGTTRLFRFDDLEALWGQVLDGTERRSVWAGADIPYEEVSASDVDGAPSSPPAVATRRVVEHTRTLYRRDDLSGLLPLHRLEPHALHGETYQLALTPGLLTRVFGALVSGATLAEGGYVQLPGGGGEWWIPSGRTFYSSGDADTPAEELFEARAHFYMIRRGVDPFGAITRVARDAYDLLPIDTVDALGNTTAAANDYRVLQPFRVTDANGNRAEASFDALGLIVGGAVKGKAGEALGDSLEGFEPDLDEALMLAHFADPLADPSAILGDASSRMLYDLFAYFRTRDDAQAQPPAVYTLTRETHAADLVAGQATRYQHALAYSDGFGREIQRKVQAEPGALGEGGTVVAPRWVGSGWTIFNNKGKAVRSYEPFFSATHRFEFARQVGVSAVLFYDPPGRVVATLHPDNSWEKVVFDNWREEKWDANDTVLISDPRDDVDVGDYFRRLLGEAPGAFVSWHDLRAGGTSGATPAERAARQDAAVKTAAHAATPHVSHFDARGRNCLAVAHNGAAGRYPSRTALDAEGKPLAVFDTLGRRVVEYCLREPRPGGGFRYVAGYDVAGNSLYQNGMDNGARRNLLNVAGNPLRTWDALGQAFRLRHDLLQRPTHRYVSTGGGPEVLLERFVYGEGMADRNLCGKLFRHYDGSGLSVSGRHDFKGNLLESVHHLAREYRASVDWVALDDIDDVDELDAAAAPLLSPSDRFAAFTVYDALNRPVQVVTPHSASMRPNVLRPSYNEANLLDAMSVWLQRPTAPDALLDPGTADLRAVDDIAYNARGQRTRLALGNGTVTTYVYDPQTFRLARLTTTRPNSFAAGGRTVQDLSYTYDAAGNVTRIRDDADTQNVIYFRNQRVEPSSDYTYDALYRLTRATGREHLGQNGGGLNAPSQADATDAPRVGLLHPGDGNAMAAYAESYTYDPAGNLLTMAHQVSTGAWTRRYAYAEPSRISPLEIGNRLSSNSLPGDDADGPYSATYQYDAHGSMTRMPHLPRMAWDERDHLRSTTRQALNEGTPETTFYVYDAAGQRVRKVTDRQAATGQAGTRRRERIYLGAVEVYREFGTDGVTVTLERETLHVTDGPQPRLTRRDAHRRRRPRARAAHPLPVRQPPRLRRARTRRPCRDRLLRGILPLRRHVLSGGARPDRDAQTLPLHRQGARRGERPLLPRRALLRAVARALDGGRPERNPGWGQRFRVLPRPPRHAIRPGRETTHAGDVASPHRASALSPTATAATPAAAYFAAAAARDSAHDRAYASGRNRAGCRRQPCCRHRPWGGRGRLGRLHGRDAVVERQTSHQRIHRPGDGTATHVRHV